ncbi:alpha/beta fold hydrolase [Kutzneria buriramensis]|uniref:Pimeloyl-ACP methyl ester carboxylesterase n=1 Tax=Kutzneria buriramensis TaxID=1045776 RepID=A0A3E0HFJ6_9PSEU|nr:alpha/beta fold hydrolase [Kutzneria buriramensis]REH44582.1 pimeloyl-ACP methyl ester carboxylesterase [Kutzneria buriramensis]
MIVHVNGVEIEADTFGEPGRPPVLLLSGSASSKDFWQPEFCRRLAEQVGQVIRYDMRDTGQSTTYPVGKPDYTFRDLAEDAVALLDHFGARRGHIVGISMGGAIAQYIGLEHADRVASLTLIATSSGAPDLPPPTAEFRAHFAAEQPADPVERSVAAIRAMSAKSVPFDETATRELMIEVYARTKNIDAINNAHSTERIEPWIHRLGEISASTLVVHGDEDPLFPLEHGKALAAAIPGARLLTLPQVGHELPPRAWDAVIAGIADQATADWDLRGDHLAAQAIAVGEPTAWFDRLYSEGARGDIEMPWNRQQPHPKLVEYLEGKSGDGRRGLVVGCGLGVDAGYLHGLGFDTTGFDVSETAIEVAKQRHPGVDFQVADLFDLPEKWLQAFDFVVEIFTVQALPESVREQATAAVASLLAPGGTLFVVMMSREEGTVADGPPWRFTRSQLDGFAVDGVKAVSIGHQDDRWIGEFTR